MSRVTQAKDNTYFIEGYSKVGIYDAGNGRVYLIDSGAGMKAGEHIESVMEERGWTPEKIFVTHNHIDHVAGVKHIREKYDCEVYSTAEEHFLYEHPELEAQLMYGGMPYDELDKIYIRDRISGVKDLTEEALPEGFEIANIDGHCKGQRAIKTPDEVWFVGDALVSEHTLNEYHIAYLYDVKMHLQALETVENLKGELFVPAHSEAVSDVSYYVKIYRDEILDIMDRILGICKKPMTAEEITSKLLKEYDVVVGHTTHVVSLTTIRSYLTYLHDSGKLGYMIKDYGQRWYTL